MMYVDPIPMTSAAILAGTSTTEPGPGETVWVSGGTYALGDLRIRTQTDRVYQAVQAHTGRTTAPELDRTFWKDIGPTLLWAPFDYYASTVNSSTNANIVYVLSGRYVNTIWLDGLLGESVTVSVKNAVGGTIVFTKTQTLKRAATGYWDYAFGQRYFDRNALITGLPIYPASEITITISGGTGVTRAVGSIVIGKMLSIAFTGWGGTQQGPKVIPKTFTFREVGKDGTITLVPRGSGVDLDCVAKIARVNADIAVDSLTSLMGRPVVWVATLVPGYNGLRTFGFALKPTVTYNVVHAEINLYIDGIVSTTN